MCWWPQTSGYSYPRAAAIKIDVLPIGETRPTRHMPSMLSPCMVLDHTYLTRSMHSNLWHSHQQSWAGPLLPRKRVSDTIHSTSANRSVDPYPVSLPRQSLQQWGQSQSSIDGWLLGLPGPYHRHAIGMFNTCSRGPTHWSLTDTGGGYKHPSAPPSLRLSNLNITSVKCDMKHLSLTRDRSTTQRLLKVISMPSKG
jgi:hypothetical protein